MAFFELLGWVHTIYENISTVSDWVYSPRLLCELWGGYPPDLFALPYRTIPAPKIAAFEKRRFSVILGGDVRAPPAGGARSVDQKFKILKNFENFQIFENF